LSLFFYFKFSKKPVRNLMFYFCQTRENGIENTRFLVYLVICDKIINYRFTNNLFYKLL